MKVMSLLNVSNPSNLLADSGFIFQRLLLEALSDRGHDVILLAPPEAASLTKARVAPIKVAESKYHARVQLVVGENSIPDDWWSDPNLVLLCNQPELAFQLKTLAFIKSLREVPLVTYVHYLPFWEDESGVGVEIDASLNQGGLGPWIKAAVGNAVCLSNACIVGSEFGRGLIEAEYGPQSRLSVIPPPIEPELKQLVNKVPERDIIRILYNHRIYGHYGTTKLFESILRTIERTDREARIVVTAPTKQRSQLRRTLDVESDKIQSGIQDYSFVEIVDSQSRESYIELIGSCHFGIAPMRRSPLWSMAMADLLGAGRQVLAFDIGGYPEVLVDDGVGLCCDNTSFEEKLEKLILDPPKPNLFLSDKTHVRLAAPAIAERFERVFESAFY